MENETQPKEGIHWRVVGMLFFILILLPAGSWLYLTKGFDYRKELMEELKGDFGKVSDFSLSTTQGKPITLDDIKENTAIVNFVGKDALQKDHIWNRMEKLHEQFDDRNDILFLTHMVVDNIGDLADIGEKYTPIDTAQWKIVIGNEQEINELATKGYKIDFKENETVFNNPYLILLDSSEIRNYYNVNENRQIGRLLEHVTIVMPRQEERDIILERDKEK